MASNATPRDPRLAARFTTPISHAGLGENRKRQASHSPVSADQPLPKLPRPGGFAPLNTPGQPSITDNEGRPSKAIGLSPDGSRCGSFQTNGSSGLGGFGPSGQKKSHQANGALSLATNAPAGQAAGGAPTAELSEHQRRLITAMISANNHAAELASVRTFHSQAKSQLDKATREYANMSGYFKDFAAIKEQHTQAKGKAEVNFATWDEKLHRLERGQETLATELVKLITTEGELSERHSNSEVGQVKKMQAEQAKVLNRLVHLEESIASFEQKLAALAATPAPAAAPDAGLLGRVEDLGASVKDLQYIFEEQPGMITTHVDARLADIKQSLEREIGQLRESLNERNAAQNRNAQTINDCIRRLDEYQANAQHFATIEAVENVGKTVAELETTKNNSNANPHGLMQFQPIWPENQAEEALPRIQHMESEIMALQAATQNHKRVLDNTTTDTLAQQMVDQLSTQFPYLKDFQGSVEHFSRQVAVANGHIGALNDRIDRLDTGQEGGRIHYELTTLNSNFKQHDEAVTRGEQAFHVLETQIRDLRKDLLEIQGSIDRTFEEAAKKARD